MKISEIIEDQVNATLHDSKVAVRDVVENATSKVDEVLGNSELIKSWVPNKSSSLPYNFLPDITYEDWQETLVGSALRIDGYNGLTLVYLGQAKLSILDGGTEVFLRVEDNLQHETYTKDDTTELHVIRSINMVLESVLDCKKDERYICYEDANAKVINNELLMFISNSDIATAKVHNMGIMVPPPDVYNLRTCIREDITGLNIITGFRWSRLFLDETEGSRKVWEEYYRKIDEICEFRSCTNSDSFTVMVKDYNCLVKKNYNRCNEHRLIQRVLTMPEKEDFSLAFAGCVRLLGLQCDIPSTAVTTAWMFERCTRFEGEVRIPYGVRFVEGMFSKAKTFNYDIEIPEGVEDTSYMFAENTWFNSKVVIPDTVINSEYMFYKCEEFNKKVHMSRAMKDIHRMFAGCKRFRCGIEIPDGVENVERLFAGASVYNQPLYIPSSVKSYENMLVGCNEYKSVVTAIGNECVTPESLCCYTAKVVHTKRGNRELPNNDNVIIPKREDEAQVLSSLEGEPVEAPQVIEV